MASIDELLKMLVEEGGSDLHISAGAQPYLRIDGSMIPLTNFKELSAQEVQEIGRAHV